MHRSANRTHADIGENGLQPTDYASSYWDELKLSAKLYPLFENRPMPVAVANSNRPPRTASGKA